MRAQGRLTARQIAKLAKAGKPGWYADGGNLYLQIAQGGSRQWIMRYTIDGRTRVMGIGPCHTIDLADARVRVREARRLLVDGIDPLEHRRAERDKRRADERTRLTFKDAAAKYYSVHESTWRNARHRQQWRNSVATYLKPLHDRPVAALDTAAVNDALAPIWNTKPETASRTRQRALRVIGWCADGMPLPQTNGREVAHFSALPYRDLPDFMAKLRERESISARALEFLILTAARSGEVMGATWDEVDIKNRTWTIPANRMKAGKQHRVPLSDRAIEILQSLPREGKYVFPGARAGQPLGRATLLHQVQSITGSKHTTHGFRSAFLDWAHDSTPFPKTVLDMALAHTVSDKVEAAYRRGDLFAKRIKLMEAWGAHCTRPPISGNVTRLRA